MNPIPRRWLAFAFALAAAVAGESLLLLRAQIAGFDRLSREDFRVACFLKAELPESRRQVLEEKLLGLPDVESARFIPRDEALAASDFVYESAALFGLCRSAMLAKFMRKSEGPVAKQADKVLRFFLHGAKGQP